MGDPSVSHCNYYKAPGTWSMSYDLEHKLIKQWEFGPTVVDGTTVIGATKVTITQEGIKDNEFDVHVQHAKFEMDEASSSIVRITPVMLTAMVEASKESPKDRAANVFRRDNDYKLAEEMHKALLKFRKEATGTPKQRNIRAMYELLKFVRAKDIDLQQLEGNMGV